MYEHTYPLLQAVFADLAVRGWKSGSSSAFLASLFFLVPGSSSVSGTLTATWLNCLESRRCFSTSFADLKVFPSHDLYFKCTFATVLLDDALSLLFTSQPSKRNLSRSKEICEPSPRLLLSCCFSIVRDMQLSVSANMYPTPHNRFHCYVKVTMFTGSVLIGFAGKIA